MGRAPCLDEPRLPDPTADPGARSQLMEERLRAAGLDPGSWSNGPGDRYAAHAHDYDKVLVVERGSIRFGLPERGETVDLEAGDRLDLPAGTAHDAVVGPAGVTCL